jgi:hypothetical protein
MSGNRFDHSNIEAEINERIRLQEDLTELSNAAMGTNRDGATKNHAQIMAVIQDLFDIQEFRKKLESTRANLDVLNLKKILSIQRKLQQRAQEFEHLVEKCLSSYSAPAQALASEYLENLKALRAASNAAIHNILEQKYQSLQVNSEPNTPMGSEENTKQQKKISHQKIADKIQIDFNASHQRASDLIKKLTNNPLDSSKKLTTKDEVIYFRNKILDAINVEITKMKQFAGHLKKELLHTNTPKYDQETLLQSTQKKIDTLAKSHALLVISATQQEASIQASFDIPAPPYIPDSTRTKKLQLQQAKETDSDATALEKQELLAEINRIKTQIQKMTNELTNEISKALLTKDLKTYKRNKLLSLSRNLYVSENSSLDELRICAKQFTDELKQCQSDARLRQGIFRKNCRTLIDSLAKDLSNDQHVFLRPKKH